MFRLYKNGSLAEEGAGANVLDSPLQALLHFIFELRSCPGATDVVAGDIDWREGANAGTGKLHCTVRQRTEVRPRQA